MNALVKKALPVLYEDSHLIVVVKPCGVPSQEDRTGDPSVNEYVKEYLKEKYKKPGNVFAVAVHRLDRPASGILVVARTSKAAARLSLVFRERAVTKIYHVVAEGRPPTEEGRLTGFLIKDKTRNVSRVLKEKRGDAKEAALSYRLLAGNERFTLLEIRLETGRSHQIRAQLAEAGMPVAGDRKYGSKTSLGPMIALHAAHIEFPHPTQEKTISLTAPDPADWIKLFGPWVPPL